ncbi:hypothetical protein HN51_004815 [Arachis hypogaea]
MQLILGGRIFVAVIEDLLAKGMRNAQNVFQYDEGWLAITRRFNSIFPLTPKGADFRMVETRTASLMEEADITAMKETHRAQHTPLQQLHAELDQEKEASATAASEAMDMILRLQGKKAAVKMEASHYKRMAEEKIGHAEETLEVFEELMYQKEIENTTLEV